MDEKLSDVQVRIVPIEYYTGLMTRRRRHRLTLVSVPLLLIVLLSGGLLYTGMIIHSKAAHVLRGQNEQSKQGAMATASVQTQASNGTSQWDEDTQVTAPTFDFPQSVSQSLSISSTFAPYYTAHSGTQSLGVPITAAFPTNQGWIQFFQWGALLSPALTRNSLHGVTDPLVTLASAGVRDPATGIIRLPLLQTLLTIGGQTPIVDNGSDVSLLTIADLRQEMKPELMQPVSVANSTAATSSDGGQGTFIKTGTRAGTDVGFVVSQSIWNYIQRPDISPDGWNTDFGTPLTAAIPFTATVHGNMHHMLVQLFWRDGIVVDVDSTNAAGQPTVQRLATGLDYLRTVGPPAVMIAQQQHVWATGNTTLYNAPSVSQATAHVGQNFPLTLLGDSQWQNGILWYHVQWSVGKQTAKGWIAANSPAFTSSGNVTPESSFDVLSPTLASYLNGIGSNVGAFVYDVTRQQYYSYNADTQFMVASSMKVPIMLTFLNMTEQQNREPNDSEMQLLTTMIENSNNDSASALFSEVGSGSGVDSYMQQLGIKDFSADDGSWGYSLITPRSMVKLLTLLQTGKILTAQDRQLALSLMEQVESDQQVGVGDTAPSNATVALKDGWVPAPDGSWVMNSSGIVTSGKETYIISVYTTEQNSLDDGQAISRKVCGTVASLLV
ncbi:MAG TPA: class A beta-lactamase [Ktedonobacter sp.]|nr:class A beta-lactamase [Ktedonobacter sp.]